MVNKMRILAGYRAHTGHIFTDKQARIYNRACDVTDLVAAIRGPDSPQATAARNAQHMTFIALTEREGGR